MRRADMLFTTYDICSCYMYCTHDICNIGKDKFDIEWIEEVDIELNRCIDNRLFREDNK